MHATLERNIFRDPLAISIFIPTAAIGLAVNSIVVLYNIAPYVKEARQTWLGTVKLILSITSLFFIQLIVTNENGIKDFFALNALGCFVSGMVTCMFALEDLYKISFILHNMLLSIKNDLT
jgi:hypothetical protein